MKKLIIVLTITAIAFFASSCDDDDNATLEPDQQLQLNFSGLEPLGNGFAYEGWIITNGQAVTTGVFQVDQNGAPTTNNFNIAPEVAQGATAFVLTIESSPDPDPAPSDVHILAGNISNGIANLDVSHSSAIGSDFMNVAGQYILATPTNSDNSDEYSGVWFLDPSGPAASLELPQLPSGWEYEGWAVINGQPVTTGKFSSPAGTDMSAPFSGPMSGPAFPGEDFLMNAPSGLNFPTNLSGSTIVISIEPVPDDSPAPFLLKPLAGEVPQNADVHSLHGLSQNLNSLPSGTAVLQ